MRKILCCLALLAGSIPGFGADESLSFDVRQRNYLLSTVFEMNSKEQFLGSIVKESCRVRTEYDLYDEWGTLQGRGSLPSLDPRGYFSWGTEIDVYDEGEKKLGVIDGQVVTGAAAKFSIYDGAGRLIGIADLDRSGAAFTVVDPMNDKRPVASYRRNFVQDVVDHWDVKVYDECGIDPRLLKIFAGFAIDSQEHFKKDS